MATFSDIAHMWANQNFGKNGYLKSGNCSCDEYNFYSYNTVIAQWLDKEKKVMAIVDENLSSSTCKHIAAVKNAVPLDVMVLYLHKEGTWLQWKNVDFVAPRHPFNSDVRMRIVEIFIDNLYKSFAAIKTSRSLQDGKISLAPWKYIKWLNDNYNNDASPKKWLKQKMTPSLSKENRKTLTIKRKMVKGLLESLPKHEIVDLMFGEGTWKAYEDRTAPLRKAEHSRQYANKVCAYLGFTVWGKAQYSYKELSAITPLQRLEIKFANIEKKKESKVTNKELSKQRALRYIGIKIKGDWKYSIDVESVVSHFTNEAVYNPKRDWYWYDPAENIRLTFNEKDYRSFCNASDKKCWMKRFYDMCAIKQYRSIAKDIVDDIKAGRRTTEDLSPVEIALYDSYLERCEKRKLKKAKELELQKVREQAEREEKLRKLEVYRNSGLEGLRNIWREHIDSIPSEVYRNNEYFYGGNVLLRFKSNELIETSKHVTLPVTYCKALWKTIKKWHDNPKSFTPMSVKTNCGTFHISAYQDDILVAGCHQIAYTEMERMYNAITSMAV